MTLQSFFRRTLLGLVGGIALSCMSAQADETKPSEADLDRAFAAVIADPSNLDASFEYARIAAVLGDFEAAVSSLERMLIYNPNLPRVHVELGVLYFRLRSLEAARSYFDQALAYPDVPDVVRERVNLYLKQIEEATSKHRFTFSVSGGVRYQTNANAAPGRDILVIDLPAQLDPEFQEAADTNVFVSGRMRHHYDFGGQRGDLLETNISVYGSHQYELENIDVAYFELETGPILHLAKSSGITVRPFLTGSFLMLSEDPYQGSVGVGGTLTVPLSKQVTLDAEMKAKASDYYTSSLRPSASNLDGRELSGEVGIGFVPRNDIRIRAAMLGRNVKARVEYQSYGEIGVSLSASVDVPAPINLTKGASVWTFSLNTRGVSRTYSAANPVVSATVREEHEFRADAQIYAPVSTHVGVFAGVGWRDVRSNLPNYEIDNVSVMGGLSARF